MVHTRRSFLTAETPSSSSTSGKGPVLKSRSAKLTTVAESSRRKATVCSSNKKSRNQRSSSSGGDVKPLLGREREFSTVCGWIEKSMADGLPLSLYISGSPGTGKSATMSLVLKRLDSQIISTTLNCASLHSQNELITSILKALRSSARPSLTALASVLKGLEKHFWPYSVTAKIIVIGIANSIDLTERLLPKLKLSHPPKTLVFTPYSKEVIAEVLKSKMSAEMGDAMDERAVELCSRKVAAVNGDLRAALHITKQMRNLNETSTPRGCREVLGVLNGVYSSPLARARLPLQPRLILAVALSVSSSKKSVLTVNSLTNAYSRACDVVKVPRLEGDDFAAAMQILESQSFIVESPGGKLILKVDADTAVSAIADSAMIAQVSKLNL
ncbi:hypothetical protein RB195_006923 [Necator americanus]|uniref:Orc1-like AAA ATPase domain-containing protein n=1 Tax=Necator americanus TaxID=51031 RepID=A0ABR1BW67_NECAM